MRIPESRVPNHPFGENTVQNHVRRTIERR